MTERGHRLSCRPFVRFESLEQQGQLLWATIDAPWVHKVAASTFAASLAEVRKMEPERILSSHLPPAYRMTEQLLSTLAAAPAATPFVGPDQEALQQIPEVRGRDVGGGFRGA